MLKALDDINKALKHEPGDAQPSTGDLSETELTEEERVEKVEKAVSRIRQERRELLKRLAE